MRVCHLGNHGVVDMKEKFKFYTIEKGSYVSVAPVPGGLLFKYNAGGQGASLCFVPCGDPVGWLDQQLKVVG